MTDTTGAALDTINGQFRNEIKRIREPGDDSEGEVQHKTTLSKFRLQFKQSKHVSQIYAKIKGIGNPAGDQD